jgi:hypothetical protein
MGRGGERPVHMGLVGHARILAFTRGSHRKILVKKKKRLPFRRTSMAAVENRP